MSDAIDEITRGKWEVDDRLNVRSGEFLVAQVSGGLHNRSVRLMPA